MRPAIYGYIRMGSDDHTDDRTERTKRELAEHATREGFALENVFIEQAKCSESAFSAMLDALKRGEVKHVVVPSLWHFAHLPGLRDAIRQHIQQETGALGWIVQGQRR